MSDSKYDETNKGTLLNNKGKYQIFRQGEINVNGDKQNFIISQTDINGKKSYPLYAHIGWINPNTKKSSEKSPDILGSFDYNTFKFKLQWVSCLPCPKCEYAARCDRLASGGPYASGCGAAGACTQGQGVQHFFHRAGTAD